MIECYGHGERQPFPEEEFQHDPDGKIHQPYIHNIPDPHFLDGTPVTTPKTTVFPEAPPVKVKELGV